MDPRFQEVLVMEHSLPRYHEHDDTSYGGGWPTMNVLKARPGKQLPVLQAPAKVIHSNEAARIYGGFKIMDQALPPVKEPTTGKLIDRNARIYDGVMIKGQALPPVKEPAPGKVIDRNEAARIYGGVVIRGRVF